MVIKILALRHLEGAQYFSRSKQNFSVSAPGLRARKRHERNEKSVEVARSSGYFDTDTSFIPPMSGGNFVRRNVVQKRPQKSGLFFMYGRRYHSPTTRYHFNDSLPISTHFVTVSFRDSRKSLLNLKQNLFENYVNQ